MSGACLIVVDAQNDFCPGGALAVPGGNEIVPLVNAMIAGAEHTILTQDWHPEGHSSFASQHPGKNPLEVIDMDYGPQVLWPDHCVQGSKGAEFHADLEWTRAEMIVRKGYRKAIDSYSALFENDHKTPTGLGGYLRERALDRLTFVGLATDFCVGYSALDAAEAGFDVTVALDACRAIDFGGSNNEMLSRLTQAGVTLA